MNTLESETRLTQMARDCAWLMEALRAARELGLRDWCIAAGAIRNLVWDRLHEREPALPDDIDLVHFDPKRLERTYDRAHESRLAELAPRLPWEVTNQAGVHLWYGARFGTERAPLRSVEEGLASWPETATAVGMRLDANDHLQIVAPFGLQDLFGLRLRLNAAGSDAVTFSRRLKEKAFLQRWPRLTLVAFEPASMRTAPP